VIFLDTSVLVPAAQAFHANHARAFSLLQASNKQNSSTGIHALTELYSVLTRSQKPRMISPLIVAKVVEEYSYRMTVVDITSEQILQVIASCSTQGIAGGAIHDAVLIACARKVGASAIYTYNLRDFVRIAPDLADIIREP